MAKTAQSITNQLLLITAFTAVYVFVFARVVSDPEKPTIKRNTTTSGFVSLCRQRLYGNHRTGNHLFMLAAMLYIAERTNREILMKPTGWCLDDVFQLNIRRFNASGIPAPARVVQPRGIYNPDPQFEAAKLATRNFTERTLALCGLYQTFVYADAVAPTLRRMLQPKPQAQREADVFVEESRPHSWTPGSYFRVGVHVRRGVFLTPAQRAWGLTVVDERYLNNSMRYFMSRHDRVQFFVATDDLKWTRDVLVKLFFRSSSGVKESLKSSKQTLINSDSFVVTFSVGHSVATDLAIIVACDAAITSTGSFSWWAGWLQNKTTIYYANWPRPKSTLARQLNKATYYPSRWITMT